MTMGHNDPVFAIGIVAQICGVHQQTLRNYERWELDSSEIEWRYSALF